MVEWFNKPLVGVLVTAIIVASILFYFYNTQYELLKERNNELRDAVQQLEQELNESLSTEGNRKLREHIEELESLNQQLLRQTGNYTFEVRMGRATLRNPFWYKEHGDIGAYNDFWDKDKWERWLTCLAQEGYNAILYWVEPWQEHQWQTFLIRHEEFPEARELAPEDSDRIIEHVNWIFQKAKELGLKNFLFNYCIVTTSSFAEAHDMDKQMPPSPSVDYRHNEMGYHFGVRNELTRNFTEVTIAELFQTYPDLDGLYGGMGEALPGKRSTWYKEAIVPGLKRSGRNPIFIVSTWMLPLEDFLEDIAPKEVYNNTWLAITANGEMFTDAKPYPDYVRWAEKGGVPTIMDIVIHNFEGGLPFNSPKLAYEIVKEYKKVENCVGFLSWIAEWQESWAGLFRKALGYYGKNVEPYSDEPWVDLLEERFGDRDAAEHFLKAYDASARIIPGVCAIAWHPSDGYQGRGLSLKYWWWTNEDLRYTGWYTSPALGTSLIPLRRYAEIIATYGRRFRNNSGADYMIAGFGGYYGSQGYLWGYCDYPVTPEAHMRNIRLLGEECLREAEEAMKTVKTNVDEATTIYNYMKAYKLLADYYERKVLAAIHALIYSFGRGEGGTDWDKAEAERLADEAVELYETAINFIWENIDKKTGNMKVSWMGQVYDLPGLIEYEKQEREQLPTLFDWP